MTGAGPLVELTALIADDEAPARRRLVELLEARDGVRTVGQCASGTATVAAVRALRPDVLFLDVQIPGLDGFEVLSRLEPESRPVVVFSTAYDEYALAAFEVHAVDYLLKPYSDERFELALEHARRAQRGDRLADLQDRLRRLLEEIGAKRRAGDGAVGELSHGLERITIRTGDRLTVVDAASVDWIEAARDYARIHVGPKTHLIPATMASLERRLDPSRFLRVHRSAIVRLDRIRHLHTEADGAYAAVLVDGVRLRVGRRYRAALLERLGMRF